MNRGWGLGARGWWLLLVTQISVVSAQVATPAQTSVTLFNSGRMLVRRSLPTAVAAGTSTQSLVLGAFQPSTLTALDAGVFITGVRFDPDWSEQALLRRSVGRHFAFARPNAPARSATLVAVDPERWQWDSGGKVVFGRPGQVEWPAELVPTAPVADVTFTADRARQNVRVMYEVSGAAWSASFRIFLGPQGRIEGNALITGGTLDLADAEVQLLAGDIGQRLEEQVSYKTMAAPMARGAVNAFEEAANESVGEAHIYTLPGRLTFMPGLVFVRPLFDPTPARGERRYTVGGGLQFFGGINQQPDEQPVPVEVTYRFGRKAGTPFGDLVLPAGGVSIYDTDGAGRMQLIGSGSIAHTPAGKELNVSTGTAFDVTAVRVQTDYSTSRTGGVNAVPVRTIAMATYRVTLQNAKDSAVSVEVREDRGGEWSVVESSVPGEKRSATRVVFPVTVPGKGTATLTYRVRVVW